MRFVTKFDELGFRHIPYGFDLHAPKVLDRTILERINIDFSEEINKMKKGKFRDELFFVNINLYIYYVYISNMVTSYKFIPYSDSRLLQISDVSCNFTIVKTDFFVI